MKDYISQVSTIASHLRKCASWHGTRRSVSNLKSKQNENGKDYVYEFFCYLSILNDLSKHYDLKYKPGTGTNKHKFPEAPANKEGVPFFYLINRKTKKKVYQVCTGTKVAAKVSTPRAPDISFQDGNADLILPNYKDVKMIYDAKRKRLDIKLGKLTKSQYSYFAIMIKELGLEKASKQKIKFDKLLDFNGNCLITNHKAHCGVVNDNRLHCLKEVELFDDKLDPSKIKVYG